MTNTLGKLFKKGKTKINFSYIILIIILIGLGILFFFPSPEDNFLAYFGTALFFVILIIFLIIKYKKK